MARLTMWCLCLMFGLASASTADAGKLSIQGHLANDGTPMDGDHIAVFAFYDAPTSGSLLWTETDTIVVENNLFSATLGKNTPIPGAIFSAEAAWLETMVDGTTLTPRIAYYPQPQVTSSGGTDSLWQSDGTNVWRSGGRVGIGISQPATQLDVAGMVRIGGLGFSPNWPEVAFNAYHTPSGEVYTLDRSAFSLIHDPTSQSLNAMVAPPGAACQRRC